MPAPTIRRILVLVVAVAVVAPTMAAATPAAAGDGAVDVVVDHRPPTEAPIAEPFRLPTDRWGAGNRGVDYATAPGEGVRASADGVVVFAGTVGSDRHVVLLHADGLRTTYGFLSAAEVRRGDEVAAGQVVGRAGGLLHFGVRAGDVYLDPLEVLRAGLTRVELVALDPPGLLSPQHERRGLVAELGSKLWRGVGAVGGGGATVARWLLDEGADAWAVLHQLPGEAVRYLATEIRAMYEDLQLWLAAVASLEPSHRLGRIAARLRRWLDARRTCTPPAEAPDSIGERRIVVLVGGVGAGSDDTAIAKLDVDAVGYHPDDAVLFSYAGGAVPGVGRAGLDGTGYEPAHAAQDLHVSAERLRALLEGIRHRHPGVPVDLVAHSLGGVVARLAIDGDDHLDVRLPPLRTLVTLGTPHQGADLATARALARSTTLGELGVAALDRLTPVGDVAGPATDQLVESSALVRELADRGLPPTTGALSIAAVGDLVVPVPNTHLDGAEHATVHLAGPRAHRDLVVSEAVRREIRLAVAGQGPTCVGFGRAMADAAAGEAISYLTDAAGVGLAIVANRVPPGVRSRPDRSTAIRSAGT